MFADLIYSAFGMTEMVWLFIIHPSHLVHLLVALEAANRPHWLGMPNEAVEAAP